MFGSRGRLDATSLPRWTGFWLWVTVGLDGMAMAWFIAAGSWLDSCSQCRVITLGGHRLVVMVLASVGLLILVVLAPLTNGFTLATPEQRAALAAACVLSLIALAGVLSIALLVAFGALVFRVVARGLGR
jgi:hypothetical protein